MESDQIDVLAFAVLRNLEKIQHAKETRRARQRRSDIRETNGLDGIDFDLAVLHRIPPAHFDVGTHPYSHAASDLAATNSFAQPFGENHIGIM